MLRASNVVDRSNKIDHTPSNFDRIEESHQGSMWAGSKDNGGLWEDDEY